MTPKKSPTTCDGRALKAKSEIQHALNSAFAVQLQILNFQTSHVARRCGLAPHWAASWRRSLSGRRDRDPPLLQIATGRRARPETFGPQAEGDHLAYERRDILRRFARPDWRWSHFPAGEHRDVRVA